VAAAHEKLLDLAHNATCRVPRPAAARNGYGAALKSSCIANTRIEALKICET